MKKRTIITTEKREVWVIRRADDNPPAPDDVPRGDSSQPETHAPAVNEISESERQEGSDVEK